MRNDCEAFKLARMAMRDVGAAVPHGRDLGTEASHDGVAVSADPTLGRVVVATRDFSLGEIVLSEEPLLVFADKNHPYPYLASFLHADEQVRARVLDLYHPPLTSAMGAVRESKDEAERISKAPAWGGNLSPELTHRLLLIWRCNAHEFRGAVVSPTEIVLPFGEVQDRARYADSALFDIGSKVEHACVANVSSSYSSESGRLEYK